MPPLPVPPQPPAEDTTDATTTTSQNTQPPPAPKPSKRVQPKYPERALEREREGTVVVILTIGAGGAVTDAQVASEEPTGMGFGSSAVAAVQRYEFAGSAPGKYTITIRFTLE